MSITFKILHVTLLSYLDFHETQYSSISDVLAVSVYKSILPLTTVDLFPGLALIEGMQVHY